MNDLAKIALTTSALIISVTALAELSKLTENTKRVPGSRYELVDRDFNNVPETARYFTGSPMHGVFKVERPVNQTEIEYFAKH